MYLHRLRYHYLSLLYTSSSTHREAQSLKELHFPLLNAEIARTL